MGVPSEQGKIPPCKDLEKRQSQRHSKDNQQYVDSAVNEETVSVNEENGKGHLFKDM